MACRSFLVLAISVFGALAVASSSEAATRLTATIGPGATIALRTGDARLVNTLKAGRYTIVVHDRSKQLNFHLVGPTNDVMRSTTLKFVGQKIWRLQLVKGKYRYFSDRGGAKLRKSFRVV